MKIRSTPRAKKTALGAVALLAVAAVNAPAASSFVADQYHQYEIKQPGYREKHGYWTTLELPAEYQLNAIHAALLHTGKVLIVAGSGNKREKFLAGDLRTLLWDPVDNTYKNIPTPADLFCGGHAFLANGKLLVAGGTLRYEILAADVKRASGPMTLKNSAAVGGPKTLPKGTEFVSPQGVVFRSTADVTVPAATQVRTGKNLWIKPGTATAFVEAVNEGTDSVIDQGELKYTINGLQGAAATTLHGIGGKMTMGKQDYQGIKQSFEFNPITEQYELVSDMEVGRWYPSLTGLADGRVIATSGLDETGKNVDGFNEIYSPATKKWTPGPVQYFQTYPALFLTAQNRLFYTGANSGYGLVNKTDPPGFWDLGTSTFTPVEGLREADRVDAAASVLLPPAQDQKVMILGGGVAGESPQVTTRTDIIDLDAPNPRYEPGPDLPQAARYLSAVVMPDDTVFTTGGAQDYRGKGKSDLLKANFYHPGTNSFTDAADPTIGRNYHSEALLLPDGRVITLGSDPLYADKANTQPGKFEQRIEIYTPPYLLRGQRPAVTGGPEQASRGTSVTFTTPDAAGIKAARLMRPSAVTHTTDMEQRSIALDITTRTDGSITVTVPQNAALVPSGWYMVFVTNQAGVPSVARWVHVA